MKRIVNGVTYNTDTSTALAQAEWGDGIDEQGGETLGVLYQTRGGAFFVHEENTRNIWNEQDRESEKVIKHTFVPMSPEEAHRWLLQGDIEVFNNPFGDPPEAEAEAEPGATMYIRVPASLKKRVDEAAKAANLSGNVWAMRCVERCLETPLKQEAKP